MRIHLPAETWAEVFAWLNNRRQFFVREMEQLWDREFSPIICEWLHVWSKGIKIGALEFDQNTETKQPELWRYSYCEQGNIGWQKQLVPIADVEMPKNICDFEEIIINHLDNTVLAFLRRIKSLLRNLSMSIDSFFYENGCPTALDHLLPLFSGGVEFDSVKIRNQNAIYLLAAGRRHSAALLNTKLLTINHWHNLQCNWLSELLANWLFTKRADGQPRMLAVFNDSHCQTLCLIEKHFTATTTTFPSFIVYLKPYIASSHPLEEKTIINNNSGQQLIVRTRRRVQHRGRNQAPYSLIICCPLDMPHERVTEWEQKLLNAADMSPHERQLWLHYPTLGPLDPIEDQQQKSGSSSEANAQERPGTSSSNAAKQNLEGEEEEDEPDKKRARLVHHKD